MAETVTLPSPVAKPAQATWALQRLTLDIGAGLIVVHLVGENGELLYVNYPTPPPSGSAQPSGATLLTALNSANLTNNSLVRRVFSRLIADGHISGTVGGSPD